MKQLIEDNKGNYSRTDAIKEFSYTKTQPPNFTNSLI
jgi:hypothetical protein